MAFDWSSFLGGAGTGASTGGAIGGPIGALIGGVAGGVGGGLFSNRNKPTKQISTFDPRQHRLYEEGIQALESGSGPLADVYGQYNPQIMRDYYEKSFAQPAYQEFQENIVPGITGSFRNGNLQNSSYLAGALGKAGSNVQNNLNAQMAQLLYQGQQSQMNRRASFLDNVLGMQTHVNQRPGPSIFDNLLSSLSSGAGDFLADYLGRRNRTPNAQVETPQSAGVQQTIGG